MLADHKEARGKTLSVMIVVTSCVIANAVINWQLSLVRARCNVATSLRDDCCCKSHGGQGHDNEMSSTDYKLEKLAELGNGTTRTIAASGDTLIAAIANRIIIFNTTNNGSFEELDSVEFDGVITAVEWHGDNLFLVITPYRLVVLNMSIPVNPRVVENIDIGEMVGVRGHGGDISIHNSRMHLIRDGSIVDMFDITSISNIKLIHTFNIEDNYINHRDISVVNNLIFIVGAGSIRVFDLADVENPRQVSRIDATGNRVWSGIAIKDSLAYLGATTAGLIVMDFSDPSNIHEVAVVNQKTHTAFRQPIIHGDALFVVTDSGLMIFSLSDPANPLLVEEVGTGYNAWMISISGSRLYASLPDIGINMYDITNPRTPRLIGFVDDFVRLEYVSIHNKTLYAGSPTGTIKIWDISDPNKPIYLNRFLVSPRGIRGQKWTPGGMVFFDDRSVFVVDFSNPTRPVMMCEIAISGKPLYYMDAWNDVGYLVTQSGLVIIQIDGLNSSIIGRYALPDEYGVVIGDGRLIYAVGDGKLIILDVSMPEAPHVVGMLDDERIGSATELKISESNLIVGGINGISFIDVSNPEAPVVRWRDSQSQLALAMAIEGDLLYVSNSFLGDPVIAVWDIAVPNRPMIVGRARATYRIGDMEYGYSISDIAVVDNVVAAAIGSMVVLLRIGDLTIPGTVTPAATDRSHPTAPSAATEVITPKSLLIPRLDKKR